MRHPNKESIEDFGEDDMPCPCEVCSEWFDLGDGKGHPRKENLIICAKCADEIQEEVDNEEEIEDLKSTISDAEWTIENAHKRLTELGAASQFRSVSPETDSIKVHATEDGKLYIKPADLFAQKKVQEVIEKASKESKETFSDWISVKDQLPKEGQHVLCHNGIRMVENSWEEYTDQDQEWFKETFTHWMPLPNPPKP